MKAIILAAGKGMRLGNQSNNLPKCLLDIGRQKLIDYQLSSLQSMGIRDIVIVAGFQLEKVTKHLSDYPGLNFTIIKNPDYAITNTAYSLWLARDEMTEDFIYFNGDVLFHPEILRRLKYSYNDNALAVVRKSTGEEEVKVILDGERVLSIGKIIPVKDSFGEFTGLARFSKKIIPAFFSELEHIIRNSGEKEYFEAALEKLVSSEKISVIDVTDLPFIEIDFPEDLRQARYDILPAIDGKDGINTPKILFYVERDLHLPFLEPIHDYISEHFDAEIAFTAPPFKTPQGGGTGHGLQKNEVERLRQKSIFYSSPEEFKADVAVVADACFYPVRQCRKIVNVGHGLISKGWFYTDSAVVRRENIADLVCAPGTWHKEILEKNIFSPVSLTGFIKSDSLFLCDASRRSIFKEKYGIHPNKKIVLFAPTFNEELSAIPCVQDRISELADEKTVLLIKLHSMTDKKWVTLYKELTEREKNVRYVEDVDFPVSMSCADVLVSDVSSAYVEFLLLDKPVVLFNNPLQKNYSKYDFENIEYQVRDAGIQVGTIEEMKLAVKLSLADPGEYSLKRETYAKKINYKFDGRCAQRAAEAIMSLAGNNQKQTYEEILFSIIVRWNHIPSKEEINSTLNEIKEKSPNFNYEVIFTGPKPHLLYSLPVEVKIWVDDTDSHRSSVLKAVNLCEGDFVVLLMSGTALPQAWLKWMHYYFKWHPDAGAVRAISDNDNYRQILNEVPIGERPESLPDVSVYFLHALMGNEVQIEQISNTNECLMISNQKYQQTGVSQDNGDFIDAVQEIGLKLKSFGYTMWNAMEVFVYPMEGKENDDRLSDLIVEAKKQKKGKNFAKANSLLENAKSVLKKREEKEKQTNTRQVLSLIETSRAFKRKKAYEKAIELLEEAKKIA